MGFPNNEIVVLDIAGDFAHARTGNPARKSDLFELGFVEKADDLVLPLHNEEDRVRIIKKLVDLKALFSYGPGWSPSELVGYYRDKGLVSGTYRVIAWTSPENYRISKQ